MTDTSWHQARTLLHTSGSQEPAPTSPTPLTAAIGRTLAQDLTAPQDIPHYDSSAMDGYATSGPPPWTLLTPPPAPQGQNIHRRTVPLTPGTATPILTGSLIPPGTQAILRQEEATLTGSTLTPRPGAFPSDHPYPRPGADIRPAGEEITAGTTVATSGTTLTPRLVGALATLGFDALPTYRVPTVSIAYTGNEVITSGLPAPGQVRDAFSPHFPTLIQGFGGQVTSTIRLPDSPTALTAWLTSTPADILIITGGSSTSSADWVRPALAHLGASYLFQSVHIRPGHPALAARLPGGPLILGLPGNPLAAHTSLYSYLPAYLSGYYRQPLDPLPTGTLTHPIPAYPKSQPRLIPAQISASAQGLHLTPGTRTRSHMLTSFATAQALLLAPPQGLPAGAPCPYLPLP